MNSFQKRYKVFVFTILLFVVLIISNCQNESRNWWDSIPRFDSKPSEFLKGPYVQNVRVDEITIMWESEKPLSGKVLFGKQQVDENEMTETDTATIHRIILAGLDIETVYKYQVVSGEAKSTVSTFKTAVRRESPYSFAAYGDNKQGPFNYEKVANLILTKNPNFVIHNGDFVNRGNIYKQWEKLFFNPAANLLSCIPLFGAIGNHEDDSENYYNFFSFPGNERWYSFDFGNTHIVIIDTGDDDLEKNGQIKWLIEDLKNTNAEWIIVNSHHPPFTAGGNYYRTSRIKLKNLLHPIFEKYGVDLVLSGHDHNYERSKPIVSNNGQNPVTYIICGNGGTPMRYIGYREWTQYAERVFGFVLVSIDGAKMHFQSFNIDNEVIDEFILDKSDPASVHAYEKSKVYYEDIDDHLQALKYYTKGRRLLRDDNFEEALPFYIKAYREDSTCVEALAGMAECYFELGKVDTAAQYALRAIRKRPNYPDGYEVLIDVYVSQEEYDQALEWCKKWLVFTPDSPGANETMTDIYAREKKYDLAIQQMKSAILVNPAVSDLYIDLGNLYEKLEDGENALTAYKLALEWFLDEAEDNDIKKVKQKKISFGQTIKAIQVKNNRTEFIENNTLIF